MTERRERTHTLTIEVPLHIDPAAPALDYDPIHAVLNVVMSVSRMALDGVVCDDVTVSLNPGGPA